MHQLSLTRLPGIHPSPSNGKRRRALLILATTVIVAAIVIATTGLQQADAVAGLFIAALIMPRAFKLMRETVGVLMEFTPKGLDLDEVRLA